MKFKVGNIIGFDGGQDRVVLLVNNKKQEYGLGFTNDPTKATYKWKMDHAHMSYKLKTPSYIPKEQQERYRKLKWQKI